MKIPRNVLYRIRMYIFMFKNFVRQSELLIVLTTIATRKIASYRISANYSYNF